MTDLLGTEPAHLDAKVWGMDVPTYCMLLHISLFAYYFTGIGFIAPIIMWAVNKDRNTRIDAHGRVVLNWIISSMIYLAVIVPLCFVLIGLPLFFIWWVCSVIFTIVGAVKASDGELWAYPLSIPFFRQPVR